MKKHIDTVHFQMKRFSCQHCEKSFKEKNSCRAHVNSVHLKIKPFSCHYCEISFGYKQSFRAHMKTMHAKLAKAFKGNMKTKKKITLKKESSRIQNF